MNKLKMSSTIRRLKDALYQYTGHDRRTQFTDVPLGGSCKTSSDIVQFYSSYENIGNYLPVLGIREMLGRKPDVCCAHRKDIDFDYINKRYKCVIIGGAGLLHKAFDKFWFNVNNNCKLPIIVWGIGACLPDNQPEVANRSTVNDVFKEAELINVRDTLTASLYKAPDINISACPTVAFLDRFKGQVDREGDILVSWHKELMTEQENKEVINLVKSFSSKNVISTDNLQSPSEGLIDMLEKYYLKSRLVVTSRLHGAIIAYSLGIPYISIAKDDKVRSFVEDYGNGVLVEDVKEIKDRSMYKNTDKYLSNQIEIDDVLSFGHMASTVIDKICDE